MHPTNTCIFYCCVLLLAGLRRVIHSSSVRLRLKSNRNPAWAFGCNPGDPCGYGSDDNEIDAESTIKPIADRDYALHDYRSGLSSRDLLGSSSEFQQEYPYFLARSFREGEYLKAEDDFHQRFQRNLFGGDEAGVNGHAWYFDPEEILNDVTPAKKTLPLTLGNRAPNELNRHLRNIAVMQFLQRDLCLMNMMREALPEKFWEDFKFTRDPVKTRTLLKNVVWSLSAVGTTSFLWHTLGMPALYNASVLSADHVKNLWGAREALWGVEFAAAHAEDATRYGAFIIDKVDDANVIIQDGILAFVDDRAKQLFAGGGAVITQHWPDTVYDMELAGAIIVDDIIRLCEMHANARPRTKNTATILYEDDGRSWKARKRNGRTEKLEPMSWLLSVSPTSSNIVTSNDKIRPVTFAVGDGLDTGGVLEEFLDGAIGYFWRAESSLSIWNVVQWKVVDLLSPYTLFSIVVKKKVVGEEQEVSWLWKLADGRGWLLVDSSLADKRGNPRLYRGNGSEELFERVSPPELKEVPREVAAGSLANTLREINDDKISTGARILIYGGLSVAAAVSFHFGLAAVGTGIVVTKSFLAIFDTLVSMELMNRAEANVAQRTVLAAKSLATFEYLLFHPERNAQSRRIANNGSSLPSGFGKLCSIIPASPEESCTRPMFCLRRGAFFNKKGYSPYGRCMMRYALRTESQTGAAFQGLGIGFQCLLDEDCESDYCHHLLAHPERIKTTLQAFKVAVFGVCAKPCSLEDGSCAAISTDHKFKYVHNDDHILELTRKHERHENEGWSMGTHFMTMLSEQVSRVWDTIGNGPGACGPGGSCGGPALTGAVDEWEIRDPSDDVRQDDVSLAL